MSTPWRALARASVVADHRPQVPLAADNVSVRDAMQLGLARDSDDRELRPATSMQIEDFAILPKQALTHIEDRCVAPEEDVALAEALALPPDP